MTSSLCSGGGRGGEEGGRGGGREGGWEGLLCTACKELHVHVFYYEHTIILFPKRYSMAILVRLVLLVMIGMLTIHKQNTNAKTTQYKQNIYCIASIFGGVKVS